MSVAVTIAVLVFVLVCILTYNSQSSFLLTQLEQAITQAESQDSSKAVGNENAVVKIPSVYSICAFVNKSGSVTKTTNLGNNISQAYVNDIVNEAVADGEENGYVSNGELMFLKKTLMKL